ncbi:MAG: N-acetylglucosamine-6-phosphate deacetylase, partial [Bacillota bacterium]|nr:N-acetylglucosamine-6-phosphate deacetylase [Bacillota bacterium]
GVHLEGPFINNKFKGAQSEKHIIPVDHEILDRYKDIIKVVTIAPEKDGSLETIKKYKNDMNFSIGHSGATYEEAIEAFEHGACCTTHLFNAMTGLHHRNLGIVGAALTTDCYSELIADNIHVSKNLYEMLVKVKGLNKLLLMTDCIRGGGLGEGVYTLGGQKVNIKNGKCTLDSGTIAGSVLKLNQGFKNFAEASNESIESIVPLITINQAKYLGLEDKLGSLTQGKRADIVIMNDDYDITKTIVKGKLVYEN